MRATISFETDVEQVEGTMAVLASSEEHNLRAAADILSNYNVLDGNLLDAITEVLRLVEMSATQLKQYKAMLVGFERARFETMVPQSAPASPNPVRSSEAEAAESFSNFLDRIKESSEEEGENDGTAPQEG